MARAQRAKAAAAAPEMNGWPADSIEQWPIDRLIPYARNARKHSDEQVAQIAASMREWGFRMPCLVTEDGTIIAGHARVRAARQLDYETVPVMIARGWSPAKVRAYVIADNRLAETATWDTELLSLELTELELEGFDTTLTGFEPGDLDELLGGAGNPEGGKVGNPLSLAERFMIPPFSILDARLGWWRDRKRDWLALGIRSEIGRADNLLKFSETILQPDKARRVTNLTYAKGRRDPENADPVTKLIIDKGPGGVAGNMSGTSIFDPVLCEVAYRWFCPAGGMVLDPFAGGSVRGIVAGRLGRGYFGIDLSADQVAANQAQAAEILPAAGEATPQWVCGDSREVATLAAGIEADFIFSCPPYADLERYSDDPRDLSTMRYPQFSEAYAEIIAGAAALLRPDRFACFVVGEARDNRGNYYGIVPDTIRAFQDAGLDFYNEGILVTSYGSVAIRVGLQFSGSRKLGKTHQNVLVFVKGNPKIAAAACGVVEVDESMFAVGGAVPEGAEAALVVEEADDGGTQI
jgi:ParB-like nuclease domain